MTAKNDSQSKFELVVLDGEFQLQASQNGATLDLLAQVHKQLGQLCLKEKQEAATVQKLTDKIFKSQAEKSDIPQVETSQTSKQLIEQYEKQASLLSSLEKSDLPLTEQVACLKQLVKMQQDDIEFVRTELFYTRFRLKQMKTRI